MGTGFVRSNETLLRDHHRENTIQDKVSSDDTATLMEIPAELHYKSVGTREAEGFGSEGVFYLRYEDESMNPTLGPSDLLEIVPINMDEIRVGDIIAFQVEYSDDYTVHRVIAKDDMGLRTRGDSSDSVDPFWIQPEQIVGRVQSQWRGNQSIQVLSGMSGLIWSYFMRALREVDQMISRKVKPLYHSNSVNDQLLSKLVDQHQPRIQEFSSNGRIFYKVTFGDRVVGLYDIDLDIWRISEPFRLYGDGRNVSRIREF